MKSLVQLAFPFLFPLHVQLVKFIHDEELYLADLVEAKVK
jgi:hypothetical protein